LGSGVKASRTVFVGDMLDLDVEGPKSIGMKTILIKRKAANDSFDVKPDAVISCLRELLAVLHDF
jgi:FMN phosphatase YigB (HAD superfamily)